MLRGNGRRGGLGTRLHLPSAWLRTAAPRPDALQSRCGKRDSHRIAQGPGRSGGWPRFPSPHALMRDCPPDEDIYPCSRSDSWFRIAIFRVEHSAAPSTSLLALKKNCLASVPVQMKVIITIPPRTSQAKIDIRFQKSIIVSIKRCISRIRCLQYGGMRKDWEYQGGITFGP